MSAETHLPAIEPEITPKPSLTDEEKLQLVAKVSADAIYDWDIVGGETRWNHGMRTLFGYAGDTVQTHHWWQERIFPDDKERVVESVRKALEKKVDYWTEEYKFRRVDGTNAHVIDRGYFIYDKDRNPLRMIGAMVDITSRINLAEAEIKSAIEERQRLARDLHDTVAQTLYSMTLLAEAVRRMANAGDLDQVQAYASRLGETAQQSLKEMRLLVYEMRTSVLEEQGLAKAIQNRLDAVEKRSGIDVHFQTNLEGKLPEPLEQGLFYIVSEALTNSLKHANATSVKVVMCVDGTEEVAIEVSDNGRGFDLNAAKDGGGIGLNSMKERAEKLGGAMKVVSETGQGTRVLVRVPFP
ncbi:MAG: PAS domain-containing protein [Anaerolineales bacterium]|nr:MAG: PAS domain-containing protein [Anaerolineales bacterium]